MTISTNPDWNRRSFLGAMLSACVAPAIVRASSLMPIWTPSQQIVLPDTQIEVVDEAWLDFLKGATMSGGSRSDIYDGRCVPVVDRGVTVMGYRFPGKPS